MQAQKQIQVEKRSTSVVKKRFFFEGRFFTLFFFCRFFVFFLFFLYVIVVFR